jgi:molecular chaperone DnaK
MSNIQPLGDRVLVEAIEEEVQSIGGILLPDSAKEKPMESKIVAVGTGGTDSDGNKIEFHVTKGDTVLTSKYGGTEVKVDGIQPAPRGMPKITVTFDLDANGILNISAKDMNTGKEQKITIQPDSGLSESEIDRMVKEAEANADADKQQKENIEIKNKADSMTYEIEKQLKEHSEKVPDEAKAPVEELIAQIKTALEANDFEKISSLTAELEAKMPELYQHFQPAPGAEGAPEGTPQGAAPEGDDVIDADFDMVDEEKK